MGQYKPNSVYVLQLMFEGLSSENIKIYQIVEGSESYIRDLPALESKAHYVETEKEAAGNSVYY